MQGGWEPRSVHRHVLVWPSPGGAQVGVGLSRCGYWQSCIRVVNGWLLGPWPCPCEVPSSPATFSFCPGPGRGRNPGLGMQAALGGVWAPQPPAHSCCSRSFCTSAGSSQHLCLRAQETAPVVSSKNEGAPGQTLVPVHPVPKHHRPLPAPPHLAVFPVASKSWAMCPCRLPPGLGPSDFL